MEIFKFIRNYQSFLLKITPDYVVFLTSDEVYGENEMEESCNSVGDKKELVTTQYRNDLLILVGIITSLFP